jgi:uncharacterized protein YdaL
LYFLSRHDERRSQNQIMNRKSRTTLLSVLFSFIYTAAALAQPEGKNVLLLVEGTTDLRNYAMGDGRQLAELLGHFNTRTTLKGVDLYVPGEMNRFDRVFYIGFHAVNAPPKKFLDDVISLTKPLVWMNTGFAEFSRLYSVKRRLGFEVRSIDSTSIYDIVRSNGKTFTKGEPNTNVISVSSPKLCRVAATTVSTKTKSELPYIVSSGLLTYFADSPFASATESDRYLLFADMLHEILGEHHEESHSALLRIEDVGPLDNPNKLREIADLLSSRGIPFLVSTIPFYVDPSQGLRISLSDKPDMVDALRYMVRNGGTLVMHGVTHQYRGLTASDFEFWDESTNKPIKGETPEAIARKLETGIQEFMKNGLYPLAWETPHYTASFQLYQTVSKYFSTAVEQRLAIEDYDYSQAFPYLIKNDLFGQTIYPENLGYIPLDEKDPGVSEAAVLRIIQNAKVNLAVRDGFASCFFHSFLNLDLLRQLLDGVQNLGYTYIDLSEQTNWVKTKDRVILSGSQSYSVTLHDQFLSESYFDNNGELTKRIISEHRINGPITKAVELKPGEFYKAEPTEFRERTVTLLERVGAQAEMFWNKTFASDVAWSDARIALLWNHYAKGAFFNDQASFAAVFRSVNIHVDTVFLGQPLNLGTYNLVIVPYAFVDSLHPPDYDVLLSFVQGGGNLISDGKTELAKELGIGFSTTQVRVRQIQDRYFPEEAITWRYVEPINKLTTEDVDETFCSDVATDAPLVIGKKFGKGRLLYFASLFDAHSDQGYSQYPYLLEYVRRYFRLAPIVRRENLEMYFEPGLRRTMSVEDLVKQWVRLGIRRIHVSGWHEYPKHTQDYERLIRLAHANGILVYAWLEPPQVNEMFWTGHPEWREKNYKGEDVRPSWRYPVALTDTTCLRRMADEYMNLLEKFDWDGVNLAELYFESGKGFETPSQFAPFHPSAVQEVKRRFGIEMSGVFTPNSPWYWKTNPSVQKTLIDYRVEKLNAVYELLLKKFTAHAQTRPGFEVFVTAMDELGSPELREQLGVDMNGVLALQKKYGFLLQVEDPENLWSKEPGRYIAIGRRYQQLVGDSSKILLDLNILNFRKNGEITPFPTLAQTGTESFLLVHAATLGAQRFTVYSEASINPQDLLYFSSAVATDVTYHWQGKTLLVKALRSFILRLPKGIEQVQIDGVLVPSSRDNIYAIPSGEHVVEIGAGTTGSFSQSQLAPRVVSFTGNIHAIEYGLRDLTLSYESASRTLLSITNEPTQMTLDERPVSVVAMKGNDCYSIFVPAGKHDLHVITGGTFSYGVSLTSLWSTTAIALFGLCAIFALVLMYLGLKIVKARYSA